MNNRIEKCLDNLKSRNKKALITFITAGYGGYEMTEKAILEMEKSGADIIELGVPFSDPIAEGCVIQNSSMMSLQRGTTLTGIFQTVKQIRTKTDIPLILMMYINSIFRYGKEDFFIQCRKCGIDGIIVPDLPFEERDEISEQAEKNDIISISLVAPTSHERIKKIVSESRGFIYCVSSTGVTGTRNSFKTDCKDFFSEINKYSQIPDMLGFGISSPEQIKEIKKYFDGIIVGSAIVKLINEKNISGSLSDINSFTSRLRYALDN